MTCVQSFESCAPRLLDWAIDAGTSASVVAAAVFAVQSAFGRWLTPAWRYRLWGLVIVRLLLPVAPASPLSVWNIDVATPLRDAVARSARPAVSESSPIGKATRVPPDRVKVFVSLTPRTGHQPGAPGPKPAEPAPAAWAGSNRSLTLTCVWLFVGVGLLIRLVTINWKLARALRLAVPVSERATLDLLRTCCQLANVRRCPPLLISDAVAAPVAAGAWAPRIMIPPGLLETLSIAERKAILLHELAHVSSCDVALNWLTAILQIVHWFNPILHLAFSRLRADREIARDSMALLHVSGDDGRRGYAQTLLKLTERISGCGAYPAAVGIAGIVTPGNPEMLPGFFGGYSRLRRRLLSVTRPPRNRLAGNLVLGPILAAAVASCTLTRARNPAPVPSASAPEAATQPTPSNEPIEPMVVRARDLVARRRYHEALTLVDQILARDPHNEYAAGIRPVLSDKALLSRRYPSPMSDQEVDAKLERVIPNISFDAAGLSDVLDFLRDVSGLNIFANWKSLQDVGVDRTTPLTCRLHNIKVSKALSIILDSVGGAKTRLAYSVSDGVLTISTPHDLASNVVVRVYDIRDLLVRAPDADPSKNQTPHAGPASRPAQPNHEELVRQITTLIQEVVATDSWNDRGGDSGAIREMQGQLIVTQTPENQLQIVNLLEQLRESRGVQVQVEARFISCDPKLAETLLARLRKELPPATNPANASTAFFMNDAQAHAFVQETTNAVGSAILGSPRLTLINGQRASIQVTSQRHYVTGYSTLTTPSGDLRYDPVRAAVDTGLVMDVEATVGADQKTVTLTLRPRFSAFLGTRQLPWPSRPPGSNLMTEEPRIRATELQTTASVVDHGTLLLGGMEDPGLAADAAIDHEPKPRTLFLLIRPGIIAQRELLPDPAARELHRSYP